MAQPSLLDQVAAESANRPSGSFTAAELGTPTSTPAAPVTASPAAALVTPAQGGSLLDQVVQEDHAASNPVGKGISPAEMGTIAMSAAGANNPLSVGAGKAGMETLHTLGALAGKVIPNSWRDAVGLPSSFKEPDYLQSTNGVETAGKVAEGIAEFVMGDEALKGLQITERLGLAQKMAQMAKSSPYIAKILEHGLTAIRGGAVTVPQQMAHGATPTEALKTGAEAAGTGAVVGAAAEGVGALKGVPGKIYETVAHGGQSELQTAVRRAGQTATDVAAARPVVQATEPVSVPEQYKALVDEAMKSGPAWTPESAKPLVDDLGKNFELRGSVGEGRTTNNDLDIWQKKGDLADAANTLKKHGFEYSHDTPHGEVWTKGDQHVDLWDSQHEPVAGLGNETTHVFNANTGDVEPVETKPTQALAPKPATPKQPAGVRNTLEKTGQDIQGMGKAIYQQLDEVSGNNFSKYSDELKKIDKSLDTLVEGTEDDARIERLEQRKAEIETSQEQFFEDLKEQKGIDKSAVDVAKAHWKQGAALQDVSRALRVSTIGDVARGATNTELINPKMLTGRLQKLADSGRLDEAFGEDGANEFLKAAYKAKSVQMRNRLYGLAAGLAASYLGYAHALGVVKAAAEAASTAAF